MISGRNSGLSLLAAAITLTLFTSMNLPAQGVAFEGPASWVIPSGHFDGTPEADLTGINPVPLADHVAQAGWWYRILGDATEKFMPDPDIQTYVDETATFDWINADGRGFDATRTDTLTNIGNGFRLRSTLKIRNSGASPLTIDIFHAADLDLNGTSGDDSNVLAVANSEITFSDGGTITGRYRGTGANACTTGAAGSGADAIGLLNDGDLDNFSNTGFPFGPGDQTVGFQWMAVVIPSGGNVQFQADLILTRPPAPPPTSSITLGYFPNNDSGRGTAFFVDSAPPPGTNNHRIRVRNGLGGLINSKIINYPGSGSASGNSTFVLPLDEIDPASWETGIQVIIDARQGSLILNTRSLSYAGHASAKLTNLQFDVPVVPANSPGIYPATLTDDRPTGQINHYTYDLIRKTFMPLSTTQVGQSSHGILGVYQITVNHPSTPILINLPLVEGQQLFWARPREDFRNSSGTNLGRFDVAPKSPNAYAETVTPAP